MNIETFTARHNNKKILSPLRDEQMKNISEMMNDNNAVIATLKSPGWKVVEKYITKEIDLLSSALRVINPADADAVRGLQSDIKAYGKIVMFLERFRDVS